MLNTGWQAGRLGCRRHWVSKRFSMYTAYTKYTIYVFNIKFCIYTQLAITYNSFYYLYDIYIYIYIYIYISYIFVMCYVFPFIGMIFHIFLYIVWKKRFPIAWNPCLSCTLRLWGIGFAAQTSCAQQLRLKEYSCPAGNRGQSLVRLNKGSNNSKFKFDLLVGSDKFISCVAWLTFLKYRALVSNWAQVRRIRIEPT